MTSATRSEQPIKRKRRAAMILLLLISLVLALPLLGPPGLADRGAVAKRGNPEAEMWRGVREGVAGYSAVKGEESGVLIQVFGQKWRQLRNGPIAAYGAWLLAATVFALGSFFLVRGKVRLAKPRTGRTVSRWSVGERLLHWVTAFLFLALAVTGLGLLYGRAILIPLVGRTHFSAYAELAELLHDYLGPLFFVGLLLMAVAWGRNNLPNRQDIHWFKAFGGLIGSRRACAERMNAGEKAWFWLLLFAGIIVSVSGLILDFPGFGEARSVMQAAHIVHVALALVLIAGALGHIYLGSIGTEGVFEGMVTGRVDETWAEQHHDLWYEKVMKTSLKTSTASGRTRELPSDIPCDHAMQKGE